VYDLVPREEGGGVINPQLLDIKGRKEEENVRRVQMISKLQEQLNPDL